MSQIVEFISKLNISHFNIAIVLGKQRCIFIIDVKP